MICLGRAALLRWIHYVRWLPPPRSGLWGTAIGSVEKKIERKSQPAENGDFMSILKLSYWLFVPSSVSFVWLTSPERASKWRRRRRSCSYISNVFSWRKTNKWGADGKQEFSLLLLILPFLLVLSFLLHSRFCSMCLQPNALIFFFFSSVFGHVLKQRKMCSKIGNVIGYRYLRYRNCIQNNIYDHDLTSCPKIFGDRKLF